MQVDVKTVIIICGATALGKTAFAIELGEHLKTHIISADSRQCYKELNIGVAKPSAADLSRIHHYFINSHSIHDDVNAAVFEQYALNAVDEILKEHDVVVMVGGTGLYINAFAEGIDPVPLPSEQLRQQVNEQYQQEGLPWLQQQIQQHDPAFWQVAEQQNPHRLLRALEVVLSTGKSITEYRKGNKATRPFRLIKIGLELPKEALHHNIHSRVDAMMEEGLLDEVESLLPDRDIKALQTVGYRELFQYLDGSISIEQAIATIKTNTRQYAKRQMTWFKKDTGITWFDAAEVKVTDIDKLLSQP